MKQWAVGYTERARRQRSMFNRVVRRVLDEKLSRLADKPWLWGKPHLASGLWAARFGWYGTVVYSIVPERHGVVVQDCRWLPPPEHPDHPAARDRASARR